jgi:hypothetical protein
MTQTQTKHQTFIVNGKATITPSGLRCQGPRVKQPELSCNKLIVKKNSLGQIAGSLKCERCGQLIEVTIEFIPATK